MAEQPVQVVITDQRMPKMTGIEFLQEVKERYPNTVRVILSGYEDVNIIIEAINTNAIYRFLTKPWNDKELKATIRQCLAQYGLINQNQLLMEKIKVQNEELRRLNEDLEDTVAERTQSLRMSQEILAELPVPVVGVSKEGIIVLVNEIARKTFSSLGQLGPDIDMQDIFPAEIIEKLELVFRDTTQEEICPFTIRWDDRDVHIRLSSLKGKDDVRGCILMLEA